MTGLATNSVQIRQQIQERVGWLRQNKEAAETKIVELANLVLTVQRHALYREWKDPATKKPYTGFSQWLAAEVGESRASVYRFISVAKHLKGISARTLEKVGNSRCFELAKIGREKPALLPRFLKQIEHNPKLPVETLHNMVANSLAGGRFDSGEYESISFTLKVEDMPTIRKALAVMAAMEKVHNPETAVGRGVSLLSICQEYLSGDEENKVLTALEKAGAFLNSPFKVED